MSMLSLSHCVSSSWAVMAPAPSLSRWQSRPTGSPLAQWQGVRVTPHWLPAYLHSTTQPPTPPPTNLLACLPAPPPSAVLIRKGWESERERERGQWPLYCPFLCLQEQRSLPCLKRSAPSLACSRSISLSLSLSCSLLSLCLALSCLLPLCVPWENPPVWILLYLCEWSEEGGWGRGWRVVAGPCVWLQTPHCFSTPPPSPFLHSSLLLLLLSQGRQLNKEVWVHHPFFFLRLSLIKSVALGRFFLFVSVWRAEDTGTQNTLTSLPLPPQTSLSSFAFSCSSS